MKKWALALTLVLPVSAFAVIPVPTDVISDDEAARALIESTTNDFDVIRDRHLLEKTIEMSPLELLKNEILQLTAAARQPAEIPFNRADLENPQDWKRLFRYVILVNRAYRPTGQKLEMWDNGKKVLFNNGTQELDYLSVSTGAPGHRTPTGYFTYQFLSRHHRSRKYGMTPMPFAGFFNGDIAHHERPPGTQGQIGSPASHGCVRITKFAPKNRPAEKIFDMVESLGIGPTPVFERYGALKLENGNVKYRNGYQTLIIVEDRK